jgi:hypothetical protein
LQLGALPVGDPELAQSSVGSAGPGATVCRHRSDEDAFPRIAKSVSGLHEISVVQSHRNIA